MTAIMHSTSPKILLLFNCLGINYKNKKINKQTNKFKQNDTDLGDYSYIIYTPNSYPRSIDCCCC